MGSGSSIEENADGPPIQYFVNRILDIDQLCNSDRISCYEERREIKQIIADANRVGITTTQLADEASKQIIKRCLATPSYEESERL